MMASLSPIVKCIESVIDPRSEMIQEAHGTGLLGLPIGWKFEMKIAGIHFLVWSNSWKIYFQNHSCVGQEFAYYQYPVAEI